MAMKRWGDPLGNQGRLSGDAARQEADSGGAECQG